MKKKKLIIIICVAVVFAAIVAGSIYSSRQKQILVETEKVQVQKEMIAKVQALPGGLTDTSLPDRGDRMNIGCGWPIRLNPWFFYHLAILSAVVACHPE